MDIQNLQWIIGAGVAASAGLLAPVLKGLHGRIKDVDGRAQQALRDAEARGAARMEGIENRQEAAHGAFARQDHVSAAFERVETRMAEMRDESREARREAAKTHELILAEIRSFRGPGR